MEFKDFETIDLASELMIPTEEKETPKEPEPQPAPPEQQPAADGGGSKDGGSNDGGNKVALNDFIAPEDGARYLVDGIDTILFGLGTLYALKTRFILTKDEKKIVKEAKRKPKEDRTKEEQALLDYYTEEVKKIIETQEGFPLTKSEEDKLIKSSKGMIKQKNWKVGPEAAFYGTLLVIVASRAVDAFMD